MELITALDFRKFWHTLTPEQIAAYITSGKLRKGSDIDTDLKSRGARHTGGFAFTVRYQVNEGTAENPSWVTCYESAQHQKSITPQQQVKLYGVVMTDPDFEDVRDFFIAAYGGVPDISIEPEPIEPENENG